MGIRVQWSNPNLPAAPEDSVLIYRSTAPMDPGALPSELATLDSGVTSYADDSVVVGTTYYYRVAFVRGASTSLSAEVSYTAQEPGSAEPGLTAPALTAAAAFMVDDEAKALYTKLGDTLVLNWYSVRKVMAAMVIWDEKQDVWETELVTVTAADIATTGAPWLSGLEDGDQLTWKGIVQLMLVPSKSDIAATVTRVLGAELMTKYGIGGSAQQAIGYWMGLAALQAGAANTIALTNNASLTGEPLTTQLTASPRSLALVMRRFAKYPTLVAIAQQKQISVDVVGPAPKTLVHGTMDRLQDVWDVAGISTGSTFADYVAGKTGDSGDTGNQIFACGMPSGTKIYGVLVNCPSRYDRAQDIRRVIMAAENEHPELRSAETAPDPLASQVQLRVQAAIPAVDSSPSGRSITNTDVTLVTSPFMNGNALKFNGASYLSVANPAPILGSSDFTIELFVRGDGSSLPTTVDLFGQWRTIAGYRSWAFQISDTLISFWYSTTGSDTPRAEYAVDRSKLFNGAPTHICVMRQGSQMAIFVNGQPGQMHNIGSATIHATSDSNVMLGGRISSGGSPENLFAGLVEEAIITVGSARYSMAGFRPRYRPSRWD